MTDVEFVEQILDYRFRDSHLVLEALTHESYRNENHDWPHPVQDRLAALGDVWWNLYVVDHLARAMGVRDAGELAIKRSDLISEDAQARVAADLKLTSVWKMGRGVQIYESTNPRILAQTLEALIGAVYEDSGDDRFGPVWRVLERLVPRAIALLPPAVNPESSEKVNP